MPQITNDTCYQRVTHIKQINHCKSTSSGKYTRHSQTLHRKNQTIQVLHANYSPGFDIHCPTNGLLIYQYTLRQLHKSSCNYNLDNKFMNSVSLIKFYPFIHVMILHITCKVTGYSVQLMVTVSCFSRKIIFQLTWRCLGLTCFLAKCETNCLNPVFLRLTVEQVRDFAR